MSVDLRKCKVGDKVKLRNGTIARLFKNHITFDKDIYPYYHDGGCSLWYGVDANGKVCIDLPGQDIVRVIGQRAKRKVRKVAKCVIFEDCKRYGWHVYALLAGSSECYTTRNNAIRGARRFCARIGFECEIVAAAASAGGDRRPQDGRRRDTVAVGRRVRIDSVRRRTAAVSQ